MVQFISKNTLQRYKESVLSKAQELPVRYKAEVVVIGGGPAGIAAAVAAARAGAKTLLLERYGMLGGTATSGLVGMIVGISACKSSEAVVGGIPKEICQRMADIGGAVAWTDGLKEGRIRFNPESFKYIAERMIVEAGVKAIFHCTFCDTITCNDRIEAVIIETKQGRLAVGGCVFIDATGDADVAFRSGVEIIKGRSFDGRINALASMIFLGGLKKMTQPELEEASSVIDRAMRLGKLHLRSTAIPLPGNCPSMPDLAMMNPLIRDGDASDPESLTQSEMALRRDAWDFLFFCRKHIPAMKDAYISSMGNAVVRQMRNIKGRYVLTAEDVIRGRKFDDGIACCGWLIDIHCPMGYASPDSFLCWAGCQIAEPCAFRDAGEHLKLNELYPPAGDYYNIPYRSLVPGRPANLLVAGRCLSATHEATASARVMATCMAMGQAAGLAAQQCLRRGPSFSEIDTDLLRRDIKTFGGLV